MPSSLLALLFAVVVVVVLPLPAGRGRSLLFVQSFMAPTTTTTTIHHQHKHHHYSTPSYTSGLSQLTLSSFSKPSTLVSARVTMRHEHPTTRCYATFNNNNKKSSVVEDDSKKGTNSTTKQMSPGTLLVIPFVVIIGLDLLLNIAFLTKRTFEYFVLGQVPSTETWW